jgi:hypothetical protein
MMLIVRARRAALAALGAAVMVMPAACVVQPPAQRYTRPNTTQQQFMQDRYECLQEAQRGPVPSCSLISACMGARGYVLSSEGDLAPPANMVVACRY